MGPVLGWTPRPHPSRSSPIIAETYHPTCHTLVEGISLIEGPRWADPVTAA